MKVINAASRAVGYVAMVILVSLMLLTVADVFLRFAFSSPLVGTTELTEIMMTCLLLGAAWCAVEGRQIAIDLVMPRFPKSVQAIVEAVTLFIGLLGVVILSWQTFNSALFSKSYNLSYSLLGVPEYPFKILLAAGFAMLALAMISLIAKRIAEVAKR